MTKLDQPQIEWIIREKRKGIQLDQYLKSTKMINYLVPYMPKHEILSYIQISLVIKQIKCHEKQYTNYYDLVF